MPKVVIISDLRVAQVSNIGKLFSGLDSSAFWGWGGVQHTLSSKRDLSSTILHKSLPTCFLTLTYNPFRNIICGAASSCRS